MKRSTQHSLAIVLRLAMTLVLFTTLQIASWWPLTKKEMQDD